MGKLVIKNKYGVIPNELLNNPEVSLRAKGLFAFLQSKPENWKFSVERIASQLKEGKQAIRKALQALEKAGYLKRVLTYDDENKRLTGYDYILYGNPVRLDTSPTGFQSTGFPEDFSKKDTSKKDLVIKTKERKNKERKPPHLFTPKQEMELFINNKEFFNKALEAISLSMHISPPIVKQELNKFLNYWTERNGSGTKQRWQLEKTFELKRRLLTWFRNASKFNSGIKIKKKQKIIYNTLT